MDEVPQKHMMNPEDATKKCASALELDTTAASILNVNFIDVNCNPGIKYVLQLCNHSLVNCSEFSNIIVHKFEICRASHMTKN